MTNTRLPPFNTDWVFFLDVDGTLSDIAPSPDQAFIPAATLDDLARMRRNTGVVLISGRSLESIDAISAPLRFPAAGQHGLEIRFDEGTVYRAHGDVPILNIKPLCEEFVRQNPGLITEYKGLSLAIHYRARPECRDKVRDFCASLLDGKEKFLCIQSGKMVEEIRLRGATKGAVIDLFMQKPAYQNKIPIFAGDDKTDDHAYKAVNRFGGISIHIGAHSKIAKFSLPDPQSLRERISKWASLEMAEL